MSPSLAIILAALSGIGVGVLTGVLMWRWECDMTRDEVERHEQARLAMQRLSQCAMRGHKYVCLTNGWYCPVCGDHVDFYAPSIVDLGKDGAA